MSHPKETRAEKRSFVQWDGFPYLSVRPERYQDYFTLKSSQNSVLRVLFPTVKQPDIRLSTGVICPQGEKFWVFLRKILCHFMSCIFATGEHCKVRQDRIDDQARHSPDNRSLQ